VTATCTLGAVIAELDGAAVRHMLAGSFASSLPGVARTTADIDLVVDPEPRAVDRLLDVLDRERFYVDEAAARLIQPGGQFNVIDTTTGWKVDLMRIRDRPFSVTEFERRVPANVLGVEVFVATAEDTVLAKLEGSKASRSDRQVQDVVDLLRVRGSDLDRAYLDHWARELGVADLLGAAFPTH
jgi:hypothetical protein